MAETTHTAHAQWDQTYSMYLSLNQKLEQAQPQDRDAIERQIAAIEEDLLDTPAPHLTAVHQKLEMLFGHELGLDPETEAKRLLAEDVAGLIQAQRELLGA